MTNASRDLLFALALIALAAGAGACNPSEDGEPARSLNPAAPSTMTAAAPLAVAADEWAVEPPDSLSDGTPGTCVSGPGYIRCWHFYPTLVLWVSPNATWARNGTPFVHYLAIGLQGALRQDDRVVRRAPDLPRLPDAPSHDRRREVYLLMTKLLMQAGCCSDSGLGSSMSRVAPEAARSSGGRRAGTSRWKQT